MIPLHGEELGGGAPSAAEAGEGAAGGVEVALDLGVAGLAPEPVEDGHGAVEAIEHEGRDAAGAARVDDVAQLDTALTHALRHLAQALDALYLHGQLLGRPERVAATPRRVPLVLRAREGIQEEDQPAPL